MGVLTIDELLDPKYRVQELTLLVDGDIYAHRAASVTDGRMYSVGKSVFKYKADIEKHCTKNGIDKGEIECVYQPEPWVHCSGALKGMLQGIDNAMRHKAEQLHYLYYLTTKENFRADILPYYKWNRLGVDEVIRRCDGDEEKARAILRMKQKTFDGKKGVAVRKPYWLDKCKEFLRKKYSAIEAPPVEADDLIGMAADTFRKSNKEFAIVSLDKDLNCIPGIHYNSVNDEVYTVTDEDARVNFYKQCLTGDDTDNIPGLPGIGLKTAEKIVNNTDKSEVGLYKAVLKEWIKVWKDKGEEEFLKSAQCLWILQDGSEDKPIKDKLWSPPEV